jgi:hypothetical protein
MEMAKYGFGDEDSQILGGTQTMPGDRIFEPVDPNLIISELVSMPPLGNVDVRQIWEDTVQWGSMVGAIKTTITPLGSIKLVTRRLAMDLEGTAQWLCKAVHPICDLKHEGSERHIAEIVFDKIKEISSAGLDSASEGYEDLERLANKLWHTTKKQHPSYIMFPVALWRQNENHYKLTYNFRGQGAGAPYNGKTGRAEQFDIDVFFESETGFLRCMGYDIESPMGQHVYHIQTPEWDERFSVQTDEDEIIETVVKMFLQY